MRSVWILSVLFITVNVNLQLSQHKKLMKYTQTVEATLALPF